MPLNVFKVVITKNFIFIKRKIIVLQYIGIVILHEW